MSIFYKKYSQNKNTFIINPLGAHRISLEGLLKQLGTIGGISSVLILIASLILKDVTLAGFALWFLAVSSTIILLVKFSYLQLAVHTVLLGFFIGFTVSPFFGKIYLSPLLVYPLTISLAIFFLEDPLKRLLYALLSLIGCLVFIYQVGVSDYNAFKSTYIIEFLTAFGLLSSLFIVGYNYFVVIFRYQDSLEQNEFLLQKKNEELNSYIDSNLQLENFAHLASHELKAPLRNIMSFSKLLSSKLKGKIPAQEEEMLAILEHQASEMDDLIKDLFQLSTVTNEPMKTGEVDLPEVVNDMIKFDFFENKELINVRGLPNKIFANKTFIKEVFKNLISNALKFISPERNAEIVIDYQELMNEHQFSVKDNGIGIQRDNREKVFLIFKRLHTTKEFEGTGIGLAICKKIIERHLGKIWIEDNPTGGSIFKFTIAKNLG